MAPLEVSPVRSRRDREAFVALPYRLHRHDPSWVPPLRRDVRALLSRRRNAFFRHSEAEYYLARREREVVGRIAAIHNRNHNAFHRDSVGFFGFFECREDPEAARGLLYAAAEWLRPRGLTILRGPTNFSTNDEAGLLVEGFETPPALMMPHNPRFYASLLEAAGLTKARDLLVYQTTSPVIPDRLLSGERLLARRYGIGVRPFQMKRFGEEIARVKRLYNRAWERNWGFVPMTDAEIDQMAKQLRPVMDPDLVAFAEKEGEAIGFAVALPDLNVALKANPSGGLFPGILRVLWAAQRISRLRVLALGTLPEWRQRGVDALLYKRIWEEATRKGYRWAEAGWILEDNHAMRNGLVRMGFEVYKTYRLYDRPL